MTAMQSFAVGMLRDITKSQRCHSDLHPTRTSSRRGSPLGVLHGRELDPMTLALLPGERARRQRHIFSIHSLRIMGGWCILPLLGMSPRHVEDLVLLEDRERLEVPGSHQGGAGEQVARDRTATGNPRPYAVSYLTLP